jgi:YjbE family integral membrane protein
LPWHFFVRAFSIVLIDLVLGGDNAVVIAFAVRTLPPAERVRGIMLGAGCAVMLRVALTFFAAELLESCFLQLIGGVLILWIAVRLFRGAGTLAPSGKHLTSFWKAIGYIVLADITMSMDNVLAIAAMSKGNLVLLVFGLGLSIPFVIFASTLISKLMDRYAVVIYLAAAVLGRVGAEMILTDRITTRWLHPSEPLSYALEAAAALGVVVLGKLWPQRRAQEELSET